MDTQQRACSLSVPSLAPGAPSGARSLRQPALSVLGLASTLSGASPTQNGGATQCSQPNRVSESQGQGRKSVVDRVEINRRRFDRSSMESVQCLLSTVTARGITQQSPAFYRRRLDYGRILETLAFFTIKDINVQREWRRNLETCEASVGPDQARSHL